MERWRQNRGDNAEDKGIRRTGFLTHQKWLPAEDRCQRFHIADGELRDVGSRVTADTVSMKPPGAIDIDRQTRSQDAVATIRDAIKPCFPLEGRRKRWAPVV